MTPRLPLAETTPIAAMLEELGAPGPRRFCVLAVVFPPGPGMAPAAKL